MIYRICLFFSVLLALTAVQASAADSSPILSVLFLGDQGHHQPASRFEQIRPILEARGISLTYTEDIHQLRPSELAKYAGLIVYANIDEIPDAEADALLEYVSQGGGFIPLHCASYCFRNRPDIVALIGAQFERHGVGIFRVAPTEESAAHPVARGYQGFESWDETYVHRLHNEQDRTVLEFRVDDEGREPWTWVRQHGKGRVFYTAWGHDERTWSRPGFANLVERGVRWACGDDPAKVPPFADRPEMTPPRTDLEPLEYMDVELPFYPPGKQWGVTAGPITRAQKPLPPEESLKHFVTPRGFHVELFASEPQIGKPLAMNWDERGRLWLCETSDYPNELQPKDRGHDRLRIVEDSDGDGRGDKFTIFAEGLSIPTAIAFYRGGAIVQDGVRTLYLKDEDGDDVADTRVTLIEGWALGDTHGGVSNFQYGLDNWFYAMQGYNQSAPEIDGKSSQSFRMGFFRFRVEETDPPRVAEIEFLRSTNNNTWGLGLSESGVVFGSTANGNPSEYMPIANRYYEGTRGWSASALAGIAESNRIDPIVENIRQVDHHGGFTAAAGHALYTARAWPSEYWNKTAFVCEPTGRLIATFTIGEAGADFRSRNSWNILASDDEWSAPIMAEVGPDGQLWVIDWYNLIVQHNPTPAGYQTGKGQAYEIELRDKTHGRIYRVVADSASPPAKVDSRGASPRGVRKAIRGLAKSTPQVLVASLKDTNFFWRRQAQRLLIERRKTDVVPELLKLLADPSSDSLGLNSGATHALWTLDGLGAVQGPNAQPAVTKAVLAALAHPSPGVRRNALRVAPRDRVTSRAILAANSLLDSDAQTRLAAFLALAEMPPDRKAAEAILAAFAANRVARDKWIVDAATAAAARHADAYLVAVAERLSDSRTLPPPAHLAIVAEHYARGAPVEEIGPLLAALATAAEGRQTKDANKSPAAGKSAAAAATEAILAGLAKGWPKESPPKLDEESEAHLPTLLAELSPTAKVSLIELASTWKVASLEEQVATISATFLEVVKDEGAAETDRVSAARQFMELRRNDAEAANSLVALISARSTPDFAQGCIEAVGLSESPEAGKSLIGILPLLSPSGRQAAIGVLLSRPEWTNSLLDGIDGGELTLADLALDQKQALAAHPNADLAKRAREILARGGGLPNPDRQKVLDELTPLTLQTGDAALGKEIFKKQCSKCHLHSGEGNKIGPDLTGVAVHPKKEILVHLIDPSRNVEGNFRVYSLLLGDGRVKTGLLTSETKTSIEIVDSEAKKHSILREDIDEMAVSPKSLMPEGFEKQVTKDELVNLLEFLTKRGKFFPLPFEKVATVVTTKGMFYDEKGDVERLIFPDWSPKTFEGVPFTLIDPREGRSPNAIMLYSDLGVTPPKMPKSVTLPCNSSARAIHMLSGVGGWNFPAIPKGSVSLIVRLKYADGETEDHELINGEHFADYIRRVDVPGSKFAFALRDQQIRYLVVRPKRAEKIDTIDLVKGSDRSAPVVMAVTVESP